jgi:hypothetical protein
MPPPGGARTPLSGIVTWLTSLGRGKPTKTNNAAEKPVDVNQFKEMPSSLTTGSSRQTCRSRRWTCRSRASSISEQLQHDLHAHCGGFSTVELPLGLKLIGCRFQWRSSCCASRTPDLDKGGPVDLGTS